MLVKKKTISSIRVARVFKKNLYRIELCQYQASGLYENINTYLTQVVDDDGEGRLYDRLTLFYKFFVIHTLVC